MIAIGAGDHWHLQFSQSSEGKIVCVMQAPDERALATWFQIYHHRPNRVRAFSATQMSDRFL
jgi:hypothetical protein